MRKKTVNTVTIYMSIGAAINAATVWLVGGLCTSSFEEAITVIAVNGCYILIARDISKKHEIINSTKHHTNNQNI